MIRGLSGYTVCRNAITLDYPVVQCVRSMIPVCDEVVISDAGSTDGTIELLKAEFSASPKVRVIQQDPYERFPNGENAYNQWLEMARSYLRYDMHLALDGDEILDPGSFDEIVRAVVYREPRIFTLINFWVDAQHACPWGDGKKMYLTPGEQVAYSHGEPPKEWLAIRERAKGAPSLVTYHYSALRKRAAFIAKCKAMSERLNWPYADQGLMQAERTGEDFMAMYPDRVAASVPFTGKHPEVMHAWLLERGWKLS